jgi:hypothetical protein
VFRFPIVSSFVSEGGFKFTQVLFNIHTTFYHNLRLVRQSVWQAVGLARWLGRRERGKRLDKKYA